MELKVQDISDRLAGRVLEVCQLLLPGGKPANGREFVCGDITGAPGDSLKVCTHGTYAGQWKDWSNDTDHGDLLDLWRLAKNVTPAEAIRQAKQFLGIVDPVRERPVKSYIKPPKIASVRMNGVGVALAYLRDERKLSPEVIKALKIESWAERKAIVFPSYSPAGELVNRSYRTLDKKVWQDKDCAPSLFGWQALPEQAYRERKVLLAEGQIDCATWLQWGIPALSIPNGAGESWIEYEWDNLVPFDTFYIAFDQDEAGRKFTESTIARLGKHKCMIVAMPKKDANDCLKAGYGPQEAAEWVAKAKPPRIKRLLTAADMTDRLVAELQPKVEPITLPMLALAWPHKGYWCRPGEVTTWGGWAGVGKSTFLNFMQSWFIARGVGVFIASFEMKAEVVLRRLLTIYKKDQLNETNAAYLTQGLGENLVLADVVGSIKQDELLEMMWFAFRRYGSTQFVIDSLMRIEALEEDYPAQGAFCQRLQTFAKETGAHVHLVAHLGKPSQSVERPNMYSIKGSSLLVNNADNIILVGRNPDKEKLRKANKLTDEQDKMMHDTEIIIEKQRETGWLYNFKLKFHPANYSYSRVN